MLINSGQQIVISDKLHGENGHFCEGTNRQYVSLDAVHGAVLLTATHESWHNVKEWATSPGLQKAVEAIEHDIDRALARDPDYDQEERIKYFQDLHKRVKGKGLTREQALEEIRADALIAIADRTMAVEWSADAHNSVMQKLADRVKQWRNWVRRAIRRLAGQRQRAEVRAMLQNNEKTLDNIARQFEALLSEVMAGREQGELTARSEKTGAERYSLSEPITYDSLTQKPDMRIFDISPKPANFNKKIARIEGFNNALKEGRKISDSKASVYVEDIGYDVEVTKEALKHNSFNEIRATKDGLAVMNVGTLLKNAIHINTYNQRKEGIPSTDVLLGVGRLGNNIIFATMNINNVTKELGEVHLAG